MNNSTKIGKFNVFSVNKDEKTNHYLADESEYICLIPFELSTNSQLGAIYLLDYKNPVNSEVVNSLIIDEVNLDFDKTPYDSVMRALTEEAGLNIDSLNLTAEDIYFLGDIDSSFPAKTKLHCYGVNLSGKKSVEFTRNLSKDSFTKDGSSIQRTPFHQIVAGDYSDSLVLAAAFLLVSYFS